MTLILPNYLKNRQEFQEHTVKDFYDKLDAFINEHQQIREPYFILYRSAYDHFDPKVRRDALSMYERRPPLIKNSMVFFVDNTRGALFHLWTINSKGNIRFNRKAPDELKDKYKVAS